MGSQRSEEARFFSRRRDAFAGPRASLDFAARFDAGGSAGCDVALAIVPRRLAGQLRACEEQREQDRLVDEIDGETVPAGESQDSAWWSGSPAGELRGEELRQRQPRQAQADQGDAGPGEQRPPIE